MKYDDRYIVELSRAAIFDDTPFVPEESLDWEYIYNKSIEQNITGLIASVIPKVPQNKQPKDFQKWQSSLFKTISIMGRRNAEFERILRELKNNSVAPLCLKGIVVKDIYPTPELRTMGDFDILIEKEERDICESTFDNMGYKLTKNTLFFEVDKGFVHGEVFFSLEDDFRKRPWLWDKELKQNVGFENGKKTLLPTYEFAYSIIHTAKHLVREGCGIRNLLDAVLLLKHKSNEIDMNVVERICKSQAYERILYFIITAAEIYYDVKIRSNIIRISQNETEVFVDYLLQYGIFGKEIEGNVLAQQVVRREGNDVSPLRRIFFPPKEMIWHRYQYVKKSSLLLPVAWIHRFITAVFVKKYSISSMLDGIDKSLEYGYEHDVWMEKLQIK